MTSVLCLIVVDRRFAAVAVADLTVERLPPIRGPATWSVHRAVSRLFTAGIWGRADVALAPVGSRTVLWIDEFSPIMPHRLVECTTNINRISPPLSLIVYGRNSVFFSLNFLPQRAFKSTKPAFCRDHIVFRQYKLQNGFMSYSFCAIMQRELHNDAIAVYANSLSDFIAFSCYRLTQFR